jgi:hypothetical protein
MSLEKKMMARTPAVEVNLISRHGDTEQDPERDDRARKSFAASPEEGRRLIQAFLGIESAEVRDCVVSLVISLSSLPGRTNWP